MEVGGGMAEEEVNEVHGSLIPGSKKVEAAEGIPAEGGASTSMRQHGKTSKPSVGIVESLATLKHTAGRRRMTRLPHPSPRQQTN